MKKAISILLSATITLSLFTGCQQTPENPIVIGKNLDKLLETAQDTENMSEKTTQPRIETSEYEANIFIMNLGIPQNLKLESISAKGKLLVHTDASILLPQADKMPIARVKMSRLANDTVKRLVEVLFEGARPISDDLSLLPQNTTIILLKTLRPM